MAVTIYKLHSPQHCYYGISLHKKNHLQYLVKEYQRYLKEGKGRNRTYYAVLMDKGYELDLLETVPRSEGTARLEHYIRSDDSCLNKKPQQASHYCTACKTYIKLVSASGISSGRAKIIKHEQTKKHKLALLLL